MKKTKYLILPIILSFMFVKEVSAGGFLSAPSSVSNGQRFTASVNLNSAASWNVHVSSSGPVSGCSLNTADTTADGNNATKSLTMSCKATGTGTITLTMSGDITDENFNKSTLSGSKKINVVNVQTKSNTNTKTNDTKTNNTKTEEKKEVFLSNLSVDGYEINPAFNQNTLDYTLSVPNSVDKIKINATGKDSATVSGIGEQEIKEGDNSFKITVSKDGISKTYNLKVTKEIKPINVKVNNKKYSIITKKDDLPNIPMDYTDTEVILDEKKIPAYRIDKINYTLVALRDNKGKIKLYRFKAYKGEEKPDEYIPFIYFKYNDTYIIYQDFPKNKVPEEYKKYKLKVDDNTIDVYKYKKNSDYSLIYGLNANTNKKNIYRYEAKEKALQLFNDEEVKDLKKGIKEYTYITYGLLSFIGLELIIAFIRLISKKKRNKRKLTQIKHGKLPDIQNR